MLPIPAFIAWWLDGCFREEAGEETRGNEAGDEIKDEPLAGEGKQELKCALLRITALILH